MKPPTRLSLKRPKGIFKVALFFFALLPFHSMAETIVNIDAMFGFYSMNARTRASTGSLSNVGNYRVNVRRNLFPQLELSIGYVLFTSELMGGDLGFGPDLGGYYYPFSNSGADTIKAAGISGQTRESYRPFVSGAFHQRNFQSLNSSYAGFSFGGGTDIEMEKSWTLRAETRYLFLSGPNSSTANVLDVFLGTMFSF